ncbi:trypsin-like peptidase domain-containing protein [Ruminococcaceae bacterium OttesenSCG-928-A16]|nr:trypsin-like peptidase domain-containing protein [Ruminococcaceae bacterium OttesenSCG-928-A16]
MDNNEYNNNTYNGQVVPPAQPGQPENTSQAAPDGLPVQPAPAPQNQQPNPYYAQPQAPAAQQPATPVPQAGSYTLPVTGSVPASQYAYVKPEGAAQSANVQPQNGPPADGSYYGTGASQWLRTPAPPTTGGGYNGATGNPGQPPSGGKKSRRGLAAVALVVACAVAGFGGGAAANGMFKGSQQTVVYKVPDTAADGGGGISSGSGLSISEIAAKAGASVVSITTENLVTDQFFSGRVVSGAGSGVIISEDGYIITNNHVVDGARSVTVTLPDGSEHQATLVGTDPTSDVAVIKIEVTGLVPATISNSDNIQVGDFCLAIGNPMGTLGGTVTDGIVSALNREITIDGNTMNLLQMSAAVSPGNSGGGLFNANGELMGIVNAKSGGQDTEGLGFAIPMNTAMKVAEDLMSNGYVTGRPGLGVSVVNITTPAAAAQAQVSELGVYIAQITPGGAAHTAGLQVGDLVVSMDGEQITETADITRALSEKAVGDSVEMQILRDGKAQKVTVVLQELVHQVSTGG